MDVGMLWDRGGGGTLRIQIMLFFVCHPHCHLEFKVQPHEQFSFERNFF